MDTYFVNRYIRRNRSAHAQNAGKLTCEKFQRRIVDQLNSGADAEDVERHPHEKACAICRQLVQELEAIAEAARDLFPDEWKTINKPN